MAEDRLRELERRFKETGSVEDEAAWLQERVRVGATLEWESYFRLAELNVEAAADYLRVRVERGDLTQEWLETARLLSFEPASVALGRSDDRVPFHREWNDSLQVRGTSFLAEVALAAAEALLPLHSAQFPQDTRPSEALVAGRAYLACPCAEHEAALRVAFGAAKGAANARDRKANFYRPARFAAEAAMRATECCALAGSGLQLDWHETPREACGRALGAVIDAGVQVSGKTTPGHTEAVLAALQRRILDWA